MPMNPRLLRPRASGFNPKSLPGFVYWLDASQASTITVSTGVSEWRDAGGSSIKATQGTTAAQPAYQSAVQNGRNAVYFDGLNDNVQLGNLSASFPSAATAIFAYKPNGNDTYSLYTDNNNSAFWAYPTGRTYIGTFKATRLNNVASPLMPIDRGAVVAIVSSSSGYQVYVNNTLAHNVAADFQVGTNHRIGVNDLGTSFRGWLCEAIFSSSALSASQLTAAYKYLDAKWNLSEAAAPTVSNADAQDWISRVYTNGGTVSASTASAVNTFCNAIDTAGIRDRFYRLNLFAGTGLSACLVPLYRGPSRTGTQYGNTTDTNSNFVSGDYVETGASGGLKGLRTSSKRLDTGLAPAEFSGHDFHVSSYEIATTDSSYDYSLGGLRGANSAGFTFGTSDNTGLYDFGTVNNAIRVTASPPNGHLIGTQTGNRTGAIFRNGTSASTSYIGGANTTSDWSLVTWGVAVFCGQSADGVFGEYSSARIGGYSLGLSMNGTQAAAFYTAMQAFQTALTRNV